MIQFPGDRGFPRESRRASKICFELGSGSFDGNDLTGMAIERLEDHRHPSSIDEFCNFEAVVQNLSDLDFLAQTPANYATSR
jgi:hypothetical protein